MTDALILAGAVAKGAFTAGALAELFDPFGHGERPIDVRRIVAASSGAVNGAFLASRLRNGTVAAAMPLLEELWIELGDYRSVFDVSARTIASARGLSSSRKVRALLERFIPPCAGDRPIELAVVVSNMDGEVDLVGTELATTYERCVRFSGPSFASHERLERVYDAVIASSAFPFVFEPATLTLGARRVQCVDGGVCNNTPVRYALRNGEDIDRVFIIAPYPSVLPPTPDLHGYGLASHFGDMLVQERLFRDLREAYEVNRALLALERALPLSSIRERALAALGWSDRRVIEFVEIRPREPLEGDGFAGFFSKRLREDYVRAGAAAARRALDAARGRSPEVAGPALPPLRSEPHAR
jgi:predicted acylesterase/phospholipase RssA